ncbi:MAG: hypothetical protein SXA11_10415 [Cyanobacteriota bacterium]|nr:hypothetical protein [Cyanobacteriota bacterium]
MSVTKRSVSQNLDWFGIITPKQPTIFQANKIDFVAVVGNRQQAHTGRVFQEKGTKNDVILTIAAKSNSYKSKKPRVFGTSSGPAIVSDRRNFT